MRKKCKMISLDTSSTITGYAYFENAKYINSDIICCNKEKDIYIRVENMCFRIIDELKRHKPDIVVVEKPPYCNDAETLILLSEIVGSVRGWAITEGFAEYVEYSPNRWRKLVADKDEKIPTKRNLCKPWDMEKAQAIIKRKPIDDNEADAVLIGIARINEMKSYQKQEGS